MVSTGYTTTHGSPGQTDLTRDYQSPRVIRFERLSIVDRQTVHARMMLRLLIMAWIAQSEGYCVPFAPHSVFYTRRVYKSARMKEPPEPLNEFAHGKVRKEKTGWGGKVISDEGSSSAKAPKSRPHDPPQAGDVNDFAHGAVRMDQTGWGGKVVSEEETPPPATASLDAASAQPKSAEGVSTTSGPEDTRTESKAEGSPPSEHQSAPGGSSERLARKLQRRSANWKPTGDDFKYGTGRKYQTGWGGRVIDDSEHGGSAAPPKTTSDPIKALESNSTATGEAGAEEQPSEGASTEAESVDEDGQAGNSNARGSPQSWSDPAAEFKYGTGRAGSQTGWSGRVQ